MENPKLSRAADLLLQTLVRRKQKDVEAMDVLISAVLPATLIDTFYVIRASVVDPEMIRNYTSGDTLRKYSTPKEFNYIFFPTQLQDKGYLSAPFPPDKSCIPPQKYNILIF